MTPLATGSLHQQRLVPVRDCVLLLPALATAPCGYLLDLATVYIPILCHHFPTWAVWDAMGWPHWSNLLHPPGYEGVAPCTML